MKAATSTLQAQLKAQPGIFMTTPKEPNFFSDVEQWQRGLDWYRGLFADAASTDLAGEASTHYTKLPTHPDTAERLHAIAPATRLIYVMRHPLDRLVSHFSHAWLERSINIPIDEATERHTELTDYGRYAMQIRPWLNRFGPTSILPVFAERLRVAPQQELSRICQFIGFNGQVRWAPHLEDQNVSATRLRDSRWRDRIVFHPRMIHFRRTFVPQSLRNQVKRRWQMQQRPFLARENEQRLVRIFDEDLAQLGNLLGTALNCTNFKSTVTAQPLAWA